MQHDFILLDRSGSMRTLWNEAISSVNGYVSKLAADNVDTSITLAVFDAPATALDFNIIRDRIIPTTWKKVEPTEAEPRGWTPLNDAIGKIVDLAKAGAPGGVKYDKVAIIIMTDGQENASRELNTDQARKLLDDCRLMGWQVVFLGANFDNAAQAAGYGTQSRHTVRTSAVNLGATMSVMADKRAIYGATLGEVAAQSMNFSEDEKTQLSSDAPVTPDP